ncbi:autotransporter-associated beta strand repeat-containing protein [Rhodanobacter sp. Root627]|uniref:autotransporter-associated beta strand repeat-containing protein n=1 Tax=Rhodanobacter sp. Root627 TaxID=1736572 RepID=UPI000A6AB910|nr:autotransporter-associated beta strand repeat-containing protein [Rhodanobacter sp. Root627]
MNRIYRLIFNRSLRMLQVASELTGGGHGSSSTSVGKSGRYGRKRNAHGARRIGAVVGMKVGKIIAFHPTEHLDLRRKMGANATTLAVSLLAAALVVPAAQAQTTHFTGATDSNWNTPSNWDNGVPTSGTDVWLDQNDDALLGSGTETIGNLRIQNNRTLTINGGAILNAQRIDVGASNAGSMTIDGAGTVVNTGSPGLADVVVGSGSTGSLTISNNALLTTSASLGEFGLGNAGTGNLFLNSGGTLATGGIVKADAGSVTFNGGIFRALVSTTDVFQNFAAGEFTLGTDGGGFDTNGHDITATNVINGSGSLQKRGAGTLTLSGANTYSGTTYLVDGTLEAAATGALGTGDVLATSNIGTSVMLKIDPGVVLNNAISAASYAAAAPLVNTMTIDNGGSLTADAGVFAGGDGTTTVYNRLNASIAGDVAGVTLLNNGSASGTIATTLFNDGSISARGSGGDGYGLIVNGGVAHINNSQTGSISGKTYGVFTLLEGSVLTNDGHISGDTGAGSGDAITIHNNAGGIIEGTSIGVAFVKGGSITNAAGATIKAGAVNPAVLSYTEDAFSFLMPDLGEAFMLADLFGFGFTLPPTGGPATLNNAGIIDGDVVLDPGSANTTTLTAGGSITGNLVIGTNAASTLTLDGDNTTAQLYSHAVTGTTTFAGALSKAGSGSWIIDSNDLSSVTGTTISDGTLQIGNGGTIGSIGNGDVANAGTLSFDRSDDLTYSGVVSGSGALDKLGDGALTLTAANSYSGGTTLSEGMLVIGNNAALGTGTLTIEDGTTLSHTSGSKTLANDIVLNGDVTRTASIGDVLTLNGNIDLGSASRTITNDDWTLTLKGSISGAAGLTLHAGAIVYMRGTVDNSYAGLTTVNGLNGLQLAKSSGATAIAGDLQINGGSRVVQSADDQIADTSTVTVNGNYQLFDSSEAFQTLMGSGTVEGSQLFGNETLAIGSGNFSGSISDTGSDGTTLRKFGTGTLRLSGENAYLGGTQFDGGIISTDSDTGLGDASGGLSFDGGTLENTAAFATDRATTLGAGGGTFQTDADLTHTGVITGAGGLTKTGSGTLILDDSNSYTGSTAVQAGKLIVGSDDTHASASVAGDVAVVSGATVGGHGSIGGNVTLAAGAHLAPGNSIGTLNVTGDFTTTQGSVLDYEFGAPGAGLGTFGQSDRTVVGGNLTLDGAVLNITDIGGFGAGVYNLFTYGGTLSQSHGGVSLGTVPSGTYTLQTLTGSKQVNLINATGLTLNFWNANGLASNSTSGGGDGTWSTTAPVWTDANGNVTLAMQPQPGFTIFGGTPGTVTVDNSATAVSATGLQFASDGYTLTGDTLTLISAGSMPILRVGDGSSTGANSTATISAVIAGTDGLNKTDLGTLILTGANTYTGGTTISAGTLQGDTTSLRGDIIDNATLLFNQTTDGSFVGTVSGAGSLGKLGAGTLTLAGANSYSGGTTISAGTLQGDTRSLQGDIIDNATLVFDQTMGGAFAGAISGTGSLSKLGAGTLTLTGANSYSGGTTISAGTLQGDTTGLRGDIIDNATLVFDQTTDGTFAGAVSGTGTLTKLGAGTLTLTGANSYSGGTTISAGTLQGDTRSLQGNITNNATLVLHQTAGGAFTGAVSGTGTLTKLGNGMLTLNRTNPFSGNTRVQAGKLIVGDDSHANASLGGIVTVASDASLGGIGRIGGLDLSGTVTPGNSIGTLHIAGDATFRPGSSYQVEAMPDGQADAIVAEGKVAILGGSALVLAQTGNWAPQTDYTVLSAAQGLSGQFDSARSSLTFLTPVLSYHANAVSLSLQRNDISFVSVTQTGNQGAVATVADSLGFGHSVYDALTTSDATIARPAFDQLAGAIHASTTTALIDDSRYVRETINRHLRGFDGKKGRTTGGTSAWASVWNHGGDHAGDGNTASLNANGSGLLIGADLAVGSDARLGAVIGHGQNSLQSRHVGSSAHWRSEQAGLYANVRVGAFVLRGGAAYAWQNVTTHRTVAFGAFGERLHGEHDAQTTQAYVEGGYQIVLGPSQQLEPFLNLARVRVHNDAVTEGGGAAALAVASHSASVNVATLGLRDTFALDHASTIHGHAGLGWQQAWGDLTPLTSMRFATGSDPFATGGVPVARHAFTADLGVSFKVASNITVDASYTGQFANDATEQGARMSLTVTF